MNMKAASFAERLAMDEALLDYYFPGSSLDDGNGRLCFRYPRITAAGRRFELTLNVSDGYPDTKPDLIVSHPKELPKHGGGRVNDMGVSHGFHVLGTDADGFVKICFTESWHSGMSAAGVMVRGLLWIECYEAHLRTGRSPHDFLENARNTAASFVEPSSPADSDPPPPMVSGNSDPIPMPPRPSSPSRTRPGTTERPLLPNLPSRPVPAAPPERRR